MSKRHEWIDALRGVAALAVVVYHAGLFVAPALDTAIHTYLRLGHWGVIVFFLTSGMLIPASLERLGALQRFWVRRIYRIYPLYWASMLGALGCYALGRVSWATNYPRSNPLDTLWSQPAATIFANLLMLQDLVGVQHLIGVYWTLTVEMAFYALVSAVFVLRLGRRWAALTLALLIGAVGLDLLQPGAGTSLRYLATMAFGAVIAEALDGTLAPRRALVLGMLTALVVALPPLFIPGVWAAHLPFFTARLAGFAAVGLGIVLRTRGTPQLLVRLGTISYSLYLVHPLVIWLVPRQPSTALSVALWIGLSLLVAPLSYRWIERPAMRRGYALTAPRPSPAPRPV